MNLELNKSDIGDRIRFIRQSGNWTLEEFGSIALQASKGNVSNWENGVNIPNESRLKLIATLGKKEIEWLLYGEVEDYVLRFIEIYNISELKNESLIKAVINRLKRRKFNYSIKETYQAFLTEHPILIYNKEFKKIIDSQKDGKYFIETYNFEMDESYRNVYLVMLDILFRQDEAKALEGDKKINDQLLKRSLDLFERINYDCKEKLEEVIKILTWITTNNLLETTTDYMPVFASSGGYTHDNWPTDNRYNRTKDEIMDDYKQLKLKMNTLIDEIFECNLEKYSKIIKDS